MATDGVVITDATDATPTIGALFQGKSFLVQQRVPQRNSFLERIRANGGRIVRLEAQADYLIADHLRKDCPPSSLSYTFVEAAIRDGAIPDPNDHRAGPAPGHVRAVGSSQVPVKATRTPFTPQDDRDVCNWVHKCQLEGQAIKGYEIYKQLEAINPRHTFQSWRDRYLKKLMNNLPQGVAPLQMPRLQPPTLQAPVIPLPTVDGAAESRALAEDEQEQEVNEEDNIVAPEGTMDEDIRFLEENIEDIMDCPPDDTRVMWESLADQPQCSHLTAVEWQRLFDDIVVPTYMKRKKQEKAASPSKRKARPITPEPPAMRMGAAQSQVTTARGTARLVSPELQQDEPQAGDPPTTPELVAKKLKAKERQAPASKRTARPATPELPQDNEPPTTPELVAMRLQSAKATQPPPSGTQKRRRETSTPRTNLHGRKRARADGSDVFANDEPADDGEDAEMGNGGHVAKRLLPDEEILATSELNRVAKAQLIAEADQGDGEMAPQAAEARDTEMELNDPATPKPRVKAISLIDQTDSQEAGIISPSNIDSPAEGGVLDEVLPTQGLQLTEENLASQQAEHGVKPTRAVDLREDDEDLEGYATYLQKLPVHQESAELANRSSKAQGNGRKTVELDPELESDRELSPEHEQQAAAANGDFDAVFADNADANGADGVDVLADAGQGDVDGDIDMEGDIDLSLAEPEGGFDFSSQEVDGVQKPGQHDWEGAPARASAQAALDTQAIYEAGMQQPDFSLPLPRDFDSQLSEPELRTSQPAITKPSPAYRQQTQRPTRKPASSSAAAAAAATPQKAQTPSTARKQQRQEPKVAAQQPPPDPNHQPQQQQQQQQQLSAQESIPIFLHRLTTQKGCSAASVQSALYRTSAQLVAAELVAMHEKLGLPAPDIPELWNERDDAMLESGDGNVVRRLCERKGWGEYEVRVRFLREWNEG